MQAGLTPALTLQPFTDCLLVTPLQADGTPMAPVYLSWETLMDLRKRATEQAPRLPGVDIKEMG